MPKFLIYTRETRKGMLEGKIYKCEKYSDGETDCSDILHNILDWRIAIITVRSQELNHIKSNGD